MRYACHCLQPVVFKVDYAVEQLGNKEFGSVFLGTTNVAEALVAAGLAKVCCVLAAAIRGAGIRLCYFFCLPMPVVDEAHAPMCLTPRLVPSQQHSKRGSIGIHTGQCFSDCNLHECVLTFKQHADYGI